MNKKDSNKDTHFLISTQATEVLLNTKYLEIYRNIHMYMDIIRMGSIDEDNYVKGNGGIFHYHNPFTNKGYWLFVYWESAASRCQRYYDFALSEHKKGNIQNSFYYFGRALHLLQDCTVPQHSRVCDLGHSSYELYCRDSKEAINTIKNTIDKIIEFKDQSAFGWVDNAAYQSYYYFTDVNGWDGWGNNDFKFASFILLSYAVRITAGFIIKFYNEMND